MFADPDGGVLVEVRGEGHQTVFPGSTHNNERVAFQCNEKPATVSWHDLEVAARTIAIGSLLVRAWVPGHRHQLALCAAGFLASSGWMKDAVTDLISAVAKTANDPELADRLTCVDNTFENFDAGKPICGFSRLEQSLGHRIALSIRGWLNPTSISTPETEAQLDELDTEAGSAEAFANRLSAELLYCGSTRHWYRRHNKLFLRVGDEAVQGMAMSFLSEAAEKVPSRKKSKFKSRGRINATVELARHYLTVDQNLLDSDLNLVGCETGSF